jgi:hypothetical protein
MPSARRGPVPLAGRRRIATPVLSPREVAGLNGHSGSTNGHGPTPDGHEGDRAEDTQSWEPPSGETPVGR